MKDFEKTSHLRDDTTSYPVDSDESHVINKPPGWKYRNITFGSLKLPWYASPPSQLLVVSFVCFLCPGMFNALGGLGGGGQVDPLAQNNASTALYSTFAVVGFFAGTFTNKLGVKTALSFGGIGYCVYVASFLCYSHTSNSNFVIFAGALLGVCAGLLWTAQGTIIMSYPEEGSKGRYISWFWMIFNLGAVIGSLIPLGQNINVTSASTVSDGTYVGFIVLTFLGAVLAWFLVDSKESKKGVPPIHAIINALCSVLTWSGFSDVIRSDGSRVILMKNPSWKSEFLGLFQTLRTDYVVVLLFPMFWASNWFYTYQFNDVNLARFDTRTRALNNTLYWLSQILGAFVFGYCLDITSFRRTVRAKAAWVALFTLTMAIWGGGYAYQSLYTRTTVNTKTGYIPVDWTDGGHAYIGPMFLYMFYGFYDAAWQTCVYWFMGAMTNNGRKLANYAGFYKGIQSAGAAVMWRLDALKTPYINEFASCWALLGGSLLIALPLVIIRIKDHVTVEEDLQFSDQVKADVAPTDGTDLDALPASQKV